MYKNPLLLLALLLSLSPVIFSGADLCAESISKNPESFAIWPAGTPGIDPSIPQKAKPCNKRFFDIHNPTLTVYRPEKPNGTAIIIVPGGGYSYVASGVEGVPNAAWLNQLGVTVFVLHYRLPANYKHPAQLEDALRAIQVVRHKAEDFGLKPDRIGIMGFSAGGHLASMAGTLFEHKMPLDDEVSKQKARPDFAALIYPCISAHLEGVAHPCPRKLLTEDMEAKELSSDLNVTAESPPTFLAHAKDDGAVKPKNSELMYEALRQHEVPAEIHIYEVGGHGGSFGRKGVDSSQWPEAFAAWLKKMEFLPVD